MRERFITAGVGGEGYLQVDFESDQEALYIYEILRSGFTNEPERESSRRWVSIVENRQELDNAFTQTWLMIKIARFMEDDDYLKTIKEDPHLIKEFSKMAIEAAKLMQIMVASAGTTKEKGAIATKKVRKRLAPVLKVLEENTGPEFLKKTITFPQINVY